MRFNQTRLLLAVLVLISGGLFFTLAKKRQALVNQISQETSESALPQTPLPMAKPSMDMTKERLEKLKIQAEIELVKAKTELAKVEKEKAAAESTKLEM